MTSPNSSRRSFIDHVHGWNRICDAKFPSPVRLRALGDIDFTHHAPADRGGLEAQASRDADASETSSGEGARATLLLRISSTGLAGVVHCFERDLGDHAASTMCWRLSRKRPLWAAANSCIDRQCAR